MNKSSKIFLFLLILSFIYLLLGNAAFAAMKFELDYPILGDDVVPVDEFIGWAFQFALGAAGAVALGVLIFGGIKYITSAGGSGKQDAQRWIQDAILGLLLLLGSYLILNTINPNLVNIGEPAPGAIAPTTERGEAWYLNCLKLQETQPMVCPCSAPVSRDTRDGDPCITYATPDRVLSNTLYFCPNETDTCVTRPLNATEVRVYCCGF